VIIFLNKDPLFFNATQIQTLSQLMVAWRPGIFWKKPGSGLILGGGVFTVRLLRREYFK